MIKLFIIILTYGSLSLSYQSFITYEVLYEYAQGFFFPMHLLLLLVLIIEDKQANQYKHRRYTNHATRISYNR